MADAEDSWVFDSLVGFLRGPVWHVPVMTFIEQKSLIFEPDSTDPQEIEYKKIHTEYKNLVDFMLGSYMEDINITPAQFERACAQASVNIKSQFHHTVFEQVWAADDYEIFKRMMIQKNIELQLQALELLQQKYGVLPDSLKPGGSQNENEAKVMEEVKRKSMEEHQAMASEMTNETQEMEMAIARSMVDQQRLESQHQSQKEILIEHMKKLSMNPLNGIATGSIICNRFKSRLYFGQQSQSSSEDKEDGLFTATDVIKEEVKRLENRLSDNDLLKLSKDNMDITSQKKTKSFPEILQPIKVWESEAEKAEQKSDKPADDLKALQTEPFATDLPTEVTVIAEPDVEHTAESKADEVSIETTKKPAEDLRQPTEKTTMGSVETSTEIKAENDSSIKAEINTGNNAENKADINTESSTQASTLNEKITETQQFSSIRNFPRDTDDVITAGGASEDPGTNATLDIDPEELQRRTEFLKAQRDKLLAMKRAEREKQLEEAETVQQMAARPKSARAARSAMGGRSGSSIDPATLKARKALAEKLKQEVVGN